MFPGRLTEVKKMLQILPYSTRLMTRVSQIGSPPPWHLRFSVQRRKFDEECLEAVFTYRNIRRSTFINSSLILQMLRTSLCFFFFCKRCHTLEMRVISLVLFIKTYRRKGRKKHFHWGGEGMFPNLLVVSTFGAQFLTEKSQAKPLQTQCKLRAK